MNLQIFAIIFTVMCYKDCASCFSMDELNSYLEENSKRLVLLDCIKYITNTFAFRTSVVLLQEEILKLTWANEVLKIIDKSKIIVPKQTNWKDQGFYILFPEFSESYKEIFSRKIYEKSKFVCVWNYSDINMTKVQMIFDEFWFHDHINIIFLVQNKLAIKIYTFLPYTENKCGLVSYPVVINRWHNGCLFHNSSVFSIETKIRNFHGCPLKVIGNHQPPDNIMHFERGKWRASGVGSKILEIAEEYFNFTSVITAPQLNVSSDHLWFYFNEELQYISNTIFHKEADLAFGWYSYVSIEVDNLDLTMELGRVSSIDCFGWAVPYRAGAKPPPSLYFTYEFKIITWNLVILTAFTATLIFYWILKKRIKLSLLLVYQILLEQPVMLRNTNASFRLLFISFCFYSMIISAAYKASFNSFITVSNQGKEFMSVYDILNSTLQISGSPEMLKILNATSTETGMIKRILRRFNLLKPCKFEDVMSQVIRQRNIAVIGVKRSLYFYSLHEAKRIKVKIPFRFIPGCLIRPHTTHFMFRRGSHLIIPFNVLLNRLFESGIIPYWILHLGANKILPIERFKGRKLRLNILTGPIYILLFGYIISICVFILEVCIRTRKK